MKEAPTVRRPILAAAAAAALLLPAAAEAHVTVQPDTAPAGGFTRLDVRVPNERDDAGTVKVDVQMPPGIISASYEPVPGWDVEITRSKLDEPIDAGEGLEVGEQISRITWTGDGEQGIVEPGQFQDFGLSLRMPEGEAGDRLTFKALQTYEGGEVVRWIGPEDADEPAAVVTLEAGSAGGGHGAPAGSAGGAEPEQGAAPAAAGTSSDDGGTDTLSIVALVVGALGLIAGLAALAAARRTRSPDRKEVTA
jgi:uncharacterized protein YcnI